MQAWEEKYYAREEGAKEVLVTKIQQKLQKGKTIPVIADELEETVDTILALIKEISAQSND